MQCAACGDKVLEEEKEHARCGNGKKYMYACHACAYTANCRSRVEHHCMKTHREQLYYCCDVQGCPFQTEDYRVIKEHMAEHRIRKMISCHLCDDYITSNMEKFQEHLEKKHYEFPCSLCNRKFRTEKQLYCHMKRGKRDNTRRFPCPNGCGLYFHCKGVAREHAKKHAIVFHAVDDSDPIDPRMSEDYWKKI